LYTRVFTADTHAYSVRYDCMGDGGIADSAINVRSIFDITPNYVVNIQDSHGNFLYQEFRDKYNL